MPHNEPGDCYKNAFLTLMDLNTGVIKGGGEGWVLCHGYPVGRQRPERFVLAGHDANGGDVAGWRYRACNTTLAALGVRVLVIND